jgi:hypothetical protein
MTLITLTNKPYFAKLKVRISLNLLNLAFRESERLNF